jgi:TrmH family RNA methyltransferase
VLTNPKADIVKGFAQLKQKKARSETGLFLLEGPQGLSELSADWAEMVLITAEAAERNSEQVNRLAGVGVEIVFASESVIEKICDTQNPQGVVAICRQIQANPSDLSHPALVAVLESPAEPGNLGTIIRVADAAGADAVMIIEPGVDTYNPKLIRATAGSIFHIPIFRFADFESALSQIEAWGLQMFATSAAGLDIRSPNLRFEEPTAWIFGNEARGLSPEVRERVGETVSIPIFGEAESLNLATAASICLYQSAFARKRSD